MPTEQEKFMEWLEGGTQARCEITDEGFCHLYLRLYLEEGIDLLYRYSYTERGVIPTCEDLIYQGLYHRGSKTLYDVRCHTRRFLEKDMEVKYDSTSLRTEFTQAVRACIEERVKSYAPDIKLEESNRELQRMYEDEAKEIARKIYLQDSDPNLEYRCHYNADEFDRYLIQYVLDKEAVVSQAAEKYLMEKEDKIYKNIILNLMAKAELKKLQNGENVYLKAMKDIMQAIPDNCRTVTVTTLIDGKELSFKTNADRLRRDCGGSYSAWDISAADRTAFYAYYGKCADYTPLHIVRITYGRNTLYERKDEINEQEVDHCNRSDSIDSAVSPAFQL